MDPYVEIVHRIAPGATLVRRWPLRVGVSAHVEGLELAATSPSSNTSHDWGLPPERGADMRNKSTSPSSLARTPRCYATPLLGAELANVRAQLIRARLYAWFVALT